VHVISLGLASLVQLITLDEGAGQWVELLELEVARGLVVAKRRGNSQIFRASIKNDVSGLTDGGSQPDSSHIHSIVSAHEGHLKAHIILIVLVLIANLGNQLLFLYLRLALLKCVNSETGIEAKSIGCIDTHLLLVTELK